MKLIRLFISLPIIFSASVLATAGDIWYFVGCFWGMMGGYIFTRAIKHGMEGIGFAFIGFPIYFFAMLPTTNSFLAAMTGDGLMAFMIRLMLCMFGLILAFIPFGNHYDR
jgi:hypothetical protein